jgi:hypothetical protein
LKKSIFTIGLLSLVVLTSFTSTETNIVGQGSTGGNMKLDIVGQGSTGGNMKLNCWSGSTGGNEIRI